jgi:DNA polymerase phi
LFQKDFSAAMTALQFDSKFLQHFWDLAVSSKEVRAKASRSLLESLRNEQKENSSKKLDYTVTRLIRGLGSSRECARQGFSLAFTQVFF